MYQTDQNRPRYMHVPNKVIWMLGWLPCTYRTHPDLVSSPPYFWMQARDHKMNARIKNCFLSFSLRFCRPTCLFLSTGKQILAKQGPVSKLVEETRMSFQAQAWTRLSVNKRLTQQLLTIYQSVHITYFNVFAPKGEVPCLKVSLGY